MENLSTNNININNIINQTNIDITSVIEIDKIVISFAGDSGDGVQTIGQQMAASSAILGNDIHTFPDFPAEIRAPAGTVAGVSGFQLCFSNKKLYTAGDISDALIALNTAALISNLNNLKNNGVIILDENKTSKSDLKKANIEELPDLSNYRVIKIPITDLVLKAVEDCKLNHSKAKKCKNMFALGVVYWLYDRSLDSTIKWIENKFKSDANIVEANITALKAGFNYALTTELFKEQYLVKKANLNPGKYKHITGNEAIALGALTAIELSNLELFVAGYPITPASNILALLKKQEKNLPVTVLQLEDEIAAVSAAIGAAYAGKLALTCTSGPGLDLKMEAIGLALMAELPLVIVDVQRAGPSTGMPTKSEQSDLLTAVYGRHGESSIPVFAAKTPGDCFYTIIEAFKTAIRYMTPVIVLTDALLANGAEAWQVPDLDKLEKFEVDFDKNIENFDPNNPYERNKDLSRSWVIPGYKDLMHRIGGLEKQNKTGNVSYEPENHQDMINIRNKKSENINLNLDLDKYKLSNNNILVITWGSSYGASLAAVKELKSDSINIDFLCLEQVYPLSNKLENIINKYEKIVVIEMNLGQLSILLQAKFCKKLLKLNNITGKPFKVEDIKNYLRNI